MSKTGKPGGLFGMGKRDFLVSLHNALNVEKKEKSPAALVF